MSQVMLINFPTNHMQIQTCLTVSTEAHPVEHYNDVIMGSMASQIISLRIVYSAVYSGADQRKHQSSASLAFVRGIHRRPVNSPHKWPIMWKMFPFDDVIMNRIIVGILINPVGRCLLTNYHQKQSTRAMEIHRYSLIKSVYFLHFSFSRAALGKHWKIVPGCDELSWWRHQMENFQRYWPFVRGIHRYPVNSPHKGQWRRALMFSLICARVNGWVNNGEAGDLRRNRAHYGVTVMDVFCFRHLPEIPAHVSLDSRLSGEGTQLPWVHCAPW